MAAKKKAAKKRSASKADKSKSQAGYDLCVTMMKRNRDVDYKAVKAACDKKGLTFYPIQFGRAQLALGIVKRGAAKKAKAKKKTGRGPGRPRKTQSASQLSSIAAIVDQIKETERERDRAVAMLAKIRDMIDASI